MFVSFNDAVEFMGFLMVSGVTNTTSAGKGGSGGVEERFWGEFLFILQLALMQVGRDGL